MLGDELRGGLLSHAGYAGNVVRRIALERFEIDHLIRAQPVALPDHLFVVDDGVLKTLARRHQLDPRRHELKRIEIARHDDRLESLRFGLPRQCADHVVRLESRERVHGDAERLEQLLAALELWPQLVGPRLPRGLVRRLHLAPEGRNRQVEGSRDVLRGHLLEGFQEDRRKAERRIGELALRRRKRGHGKERPIDQAVGVDEGEALGHLTSIAARPTEPSARG